MATPKYTSQSGIYVIVNTKTGKLYIGQTQSLKHRWQHHRSNLRIKKHRNNHLQHAWNKCGEKAFRFQVLEYCPIEKLDEREQYWLNIYIPKGVCYNIAIDAVATNRGRKFSEEHVRKMTEARHKRPPISEESRKRMSEAHKGQRLTEEHKRKLSESGKSKPPISEEHRRKLSEGAKRQHARNKANKEGLK